MAHGVKTYGTAGTEVRVLDDVTVSFESGAFSAIMGAGDDRCRCRGYRHQLVFDPSGDDEEARPFIRGARPTRPLRAGELRPRRNSRVWNRPLAARLPLAALGSTTAPGRPLWAAANSRSASRRPG